MPMSAVPATHARSAKLSLSSYWLPNPAAWGRIRELNLYRTCGIAALGTKCIQDRFLSSLQALW